MQTKRWLIQMKSVVQTAAATAVVCILALLLTGLIPQEAIRDSVQESAGYFYEKDLFPYLLKEQFNTRQDNYADCILVNIMYHIDKKALPASLIRAAYYNPELENVDVSLYDAVREEKQPNVEYFRYWHGSMVLLRPLFLITGIVGARGILGIALLLLTLGVAWMLIRRKETALGVSYLVGNLLLQTWMCAFCIEYITTFLAMNVTALCMVVLYDRWGQKREKMDRQVRMLLAASGVVTCFVDFLTTETLTVTMPLLILAILRYRDDRLLGLREEVQGMATSGLIWGASYGGMFALKWVISAALLGRDAFRAALASAGERIVGTVTLGNTNLDPEASSVERLMGALTWNWGSLFPFRSEMKMGAAIVLFFSLLFVGFAIVYLFRDKTFSGKLTVLCLLLSCVPYLRYVVLANHSYLHYFFTYRAQLTGIVALCYCTWRFGLGCLTGSRQNAAGVKKWKKKKEDRRILRIKYK